jgi:hypothetical protein
VADPEQVVARAVQVADVLTRIVADRGLARRFGDQAERDWLMYPAWAILGSQLGVLAIVTSTASLADGTGWEAHAEARLLDGTVVGAADGMAQAGERRRREGAAPPTQHSIRALSQTRAMRRAYQAALSGVVALAGWDVSSPDLPATRRQVTALWTVAKELEWDRDRTHAEAGAASLNDLTREAAAELFESWSALLEETRAPVVDAEGTVSPNAFVGDEAEPCKACRFAVEHPVHAKGRRDRSAGPSSPDSALESA